MSVSAVEFNLQIFVRSSMSWSLAMRRCGSP